MPRTGYSDIAAHFRQRIQEGDLSPGASMPSMREVSEEWDVTITTVNRAFRMLKTEGLTYSKPGVGTVVSAARQQVTGAGRLRRLARTGRPYANGETSIKHTAQILPCADRNITDLLDVDPHDEIVVRTRVFVRNERPAIFAMSCIHPRALRVVPEIARPERLHTFWQTLYTERTGEEITRSPEESTARHAYDYELEALEIDVPQHSAVPVLQLRNVFHDEKGEVIEVWEDVYAPQVPRVEDITDDRAQT